MTINVRITREDDRRDVVALVYNKDKSLTKPGLVTKLIDKGDSCVVAVFDTRDIIIKEEKA